MTMQLKDRVKSVYDRAAKAVSGSRLSRVRFGKGSMLTVIVLSMLLGYNVVTSEVSQCEAQGQVPPATPVTVVGGTCFLSVPPYCNPVPCEPSGTASSARSLIFNAFSQLLEKLTNQVPPFIATQNGGGTTTSGYGLEGYLGGIVDQMMMALMDRLNDIELEYIDWFDTMWFYNLEPAMKDQTDQINTATADQTQTFQGGQDAEDEDQINQGVMVQEQKNTAIMQPSENGPCVGGSTAGSSARGYNIGRHLKLAMQKDTFDDGLNRKGTPSAQGQAAKARIRNTNYKDVTCNPDDNDGNNNCGASTGAPALYNADTKASKTLYGSLTIPLHDPANGAKYETAVKALLDNMTGDPTPNPMTADVLKSSEGQEEWMDRRSHLARMAAVRSVPNLGISWRSPGTQLAKYVKELREAAGVPTPEISDNPSYKEVIHAVAVDRFNSGKYAQNTMTNPLDIEMEKLTIDSFYLMQLRDYNELLERMALALSVQVAMMVDEIQLPVPKASKPVGN